MSERAAINPTLCFMIDSIQGCEGPPYTLHSARSICELFTKMLFLRMFRLSTLSDTVRLYHSRFISRRNVEDSFYDLRKKVCLARAPSQKQRIIFTLV